MSANEKFIAPPLCVQRTWSQTSRCGTRAARCGPRAVNLVTPSCFDNHNGSKLRRASRHHAPVFVHRRTAEKPEAETEDWEIFQDVSCATAGPYLRGASSTRFRDPEAHLLVRVIMAARQTANRLLSRLAPVRPPADPQLVGILLRLAPRFKKGTPSRVPVAAPAPADPRAPSFPTRALHDRREALAGSPRSPRCSWTRTPR